MSDPLSSLSSHYGIGSDIPMRPSSPLPTTPVGPLVSQISAANVAVTVFAASAIGNVADIINPPSATEPLYVDVVGVAAAGSATSIPLMPGQAYRVSAPIRTAVTAVAATAGHAFVAVKY